MHHDVRHSGASLKFNWMAVTTKLAATARGKTSTHWNK